MVSEKEVWAIGELDCNEVERKAATAEVEITRLKYRPERITTLFVGESAPASGDFFYYRRSDLYRCMKAAMEAAGLGGSGNFLEHFKALGWYLDDLVLTPVNKGLSDSERKDACRVAQPCLAKRIAEYQPLAIVSLLLAGRVKKSVYAAAAEGCNSADCYAVHFPGQGNQRRFLSDMARIISRLPKSASLIELLDRLKRLAIIAMFSDDDLMEVLVLKGGNLLDSIYKIASRASADVDFSLQGEFKKEELGLIEAKIRRALTDTFQAEGFTVFDINFSERPKRVPPGMPEFWGGYRIEFKVIEIKRYEELKGNLRALRTGATVLGRNQEKKFSIDISKFEHCISKRELELDEGFTIYVYSPEMIVFEKIRAICQQMEEYGLVVPNSGKST